MNWYVVLIRGINVGGKNKMPMTELRQFLGELDFTDVATYIQSGNVLLRSKLSSEKVQQVIEDMLPKKFTVDSELIKVLVLSHNQLKSIVTSAPKGFGAKPDTFHSDVIFLMNIGVDEALKVFSPKEGIDCIWPGDRVIYSQRLSAERVKSRLNKIVGTQAYKSMTIRNWNTTTKLLALLDSMNSDK